MGCLLEAGALEKVVRLFPPCVSPYVLWLDAQESADRPGPSVEAALLWWAVNWTRDLKRDPILSRWSGKTESL